MKKNYTILSLLTVLFTLTMNAQVVYVDIPDGQPAGLDFNQDGTKEFDISSQNKLGDYIEYIAYGMGNNIHAVGDQTNAWDVPALQAQGFTVDASNNWAGMGMLILMVILPIPREILQLSPAPINIWL